MKRLNWVVAAVLAAAIAVPASAQVGIYFRVGPPAVRYEERTVAPGPGYYWVEGYWAPNGRHYRWVPGHWERAPFEGAYWSHPHYDHERDGWRFHEGHWDHENHDRR
jgi:hypothetical protein